MKVITGYPVYIDNKRVGEAGNNWIYATGDEPSDSVKQDKAKNEGKIWDKATGAWRKMTQDESSRFNKLKSSGAFGVLGQLLGLNTPPITTTTTTTPPIPPTNDPKKGMSTTTKIVLFGGAAVIIGLAVWAMTKGNSSKAKVA